MLAVVVIVLGGAGSAVAFVPLPPGAQVNDDLAAGINKNISVAGEDPTFDWSSNKPFWKADLDQATGLFRQAIISHLITTKHAVPLMIAARRSTICSIGPCMRSTAVTARRQPLWRVRCGP